VGGHTPSVEQARLGQHEEQPEPSDAEIDAAMSGNKIWRRSRGWRLIRSCIDSSFPYVLLFGTLATIVSLATVWIFTALSFRARAAPAAPRHVEYILGAPGNRRRRRARHSKPRAAELLDELPAPHTFRTGGRPRLTHLTVVPGRKYFLRPVYAEGGEQEGAAASELTLGFANTHPWNAAVLARTITHVMPRVEKR